MASRNPRTPGLTRTQQLRQAKSSAMVQQFDQKEEMTRRRDGGGIPKPRRKPPPEPKKVDFSRPGLTKAMLARAKHAEKFREDLERKKMAETGTRMPRRTPAPIGGDARMGREKSFRRRSPSPPSRGVSPSGVAEVARPCPRKFSKGGRRLQEPGPTVVPERTNQLARSMNADVVQAEPVGDGPIDSIVIPPGAVSGQRTTIVSIPQQASGPEAAAAASQVANRSIQVISETLDEQDAAEASAVQCKLVELQQARRDFVIAVANVGGNAVNIGEGAGEPAPKPKSPVRGIYRIPDITDRRLQIEYGRDHPTVVAAREFAQRSMAALREAEASRRAEEEFARFAMQPIPEDLRLDEPLDEEFLEEEDFSWEEDEETGMQVPCPRRIPIPRRMETYDYEPFDPEQLERFFDVERYPGAARPPLGRENLPQDLWELEDPWYRPCPMPEGPDLIDFSN